MKLFGEFLVESNAISEEQLLEALVAQLKLTPSVCQIVFENQLMSTTEILQILSHQARNKLGFIESAKELGLWNQNVAEKIEAQVALSRPPLGQIFAKHRILPIADLSRHLDEFLDTLKAEDLLQPEANVIASDTSSFLEIYSEGLHEGLINNVQLLTFWSEMSEADRMAVTDFLINHFHLFQNILKDAGLKEEEIFFNDLETLVREMAPAIPDYSAPKILKIQKSMEEVLAMAWRLRQSYTEKNDPSNLREKGNLALQDLKKLLIE